MFILHYSPGAVSLATHFALEEAALPYRLEPHVVQKGENRTPEYLRIHPLGRVPALEFADGTVLTETPALLWFISAQVPDRGLMPTASDAVARANEWMSLFVSALHPTFLSFYRPDRYTADRQACDALRGDGRSRFQALLEHVESRLPDSAFVLGDAFSLVDSYALVFLLWARRFELEVARLPRYAALADRLLARPAVRCSLQQEGFAVPE